MKIQSLHIQNFTVFEDQKFDFCDGINVFIGANATGKTHALKALYCTARGVGHIPRQQTEVIPPDSIASLADVFRPDDRDVSRLLRHSDRQKESGEITTKGKTGGKKWDTTLRIPPSLPTSHGLEMGTPRDELGRIIFFPPHEMLSAYEGFSGLWEKREISYEETYYDICRHLNVPVLREKRLPDLISGLTDILGGSVVEKNGRFYVKQPSGRLLEAHLLAEGHRKLAMLVRLIANGEIEKDTVLLWDEPESGLNPRLITEVAKAIRQLAAAGVQVFVATHDYLLTGELSVLAEYKQKPDVATRFFAFSRASDDPAAPVAVQSGNLLQDLSDNPILKEFVAHYDREERLFAASQRKQGAAQ